MEIIRADIVARYKKRSGFEVFFNTGTDEHGIKIYRKAVENTKTPQKYVDEYAAKFKNLLPVLGVGIGEGAVPVHFIRTTDAQHVAAAQEFWRRCDTAGDIYKKNYKVKYCVGCELEKTESELVDGRCPIHPSQELESIEEENYFFAFSKYQQRLLDLYAATPDFVVPASRLGEIKAFVERGLEDFSISRLASKMPWGVPVPGDEKQVMYVWFDALVSYISTLGWPTVAGDFEKFWVESGGVVQYCGKDNLRQQSAMWQGMLMSAGQHSPELIASRQIIINGFITSGGKKMSKSEGNVIDPITVVNEYGAEAFRYYVARELHPFEDSDFTMEKFKNAYNSHLANGLGNLVSRIMKMSSTNLSHDTSNSSISTSLFEMSEMQFPVEYRKALDSYDIQAAANIVWSHVGALDATIQETAPFKLVKTDKAAGLKIIEDLVVRLFAIAHMLQPIMPETAAKIIALIQANAAPEAPLFQRKD